MLVASSLRKLVEEERDESIFVKTQSISEKSREDNAMTSRQCQKQATCETPRRAPEKTHGECNEEYQCQLHALLKETKIKSPSGSYCFDDDADEGEVRRVIFPEYIKI